MPVSVAGGAMLRLAGDRESLRDAGRRFLDRSLGRVSAVGAPAPKAPALEDIDKRDFDQVDDLAELQLNSLKAENNPALRRRYAAEAFRREYINWEAKEFPFLQGSGSVRLEFWKIFFAAKGGWSAYEADRSATNMPVPLASGLRLWVEFWSARASFMTESDKVLKLMNTIRDMVAALDTPQDLDKKNSLDAEIRKLSETNLGMQNAWKTVSARIPEYYRAANVRKTALLQEAKPHPQEGVELRFFGGTGADRDEGRWAGESNSDGDIVRLVLAATNASNQHDISKRLVQEYNKDAEFAKRVNDGKELAKQRKAAEDAARKAANAARLEKEKFEIQKQREADREDAKAVKDATDAACRAEKSNASAAALLAEAKKAQEEAQEIPREIAARITDLGEMGGNAPTELDAILREKKAIMNEKLRAASSALAEIDVKVQIASAEADAAAQSAAEANGFLESVKEAAAQQRVADRTQLVQWTTHRANAAKEAEARARSAKKAAVEQLGIAVSSRNACSRELETVATALRRVAAKAEAAEKKRTQADARAEAKKEEKRVALEARATKAKKKAEEKEQARSQAEARREEREAARELSTLQKVNIWKENHAEEDDSAKSWALFSKEKEDWSKERKAATANGTLQKHMLSLGNKRRAMIDLATNASVLSKMIPMPYSKWQSRREEWPWHTVVVADEIMGSARGFNSVLDEIWEEVAYKAAFDLENFKVEVAATSSQKDVDRLVQENFQPGSEVAAPRMETFLFSTEQLIKKSFSKGDVEKALDWLTTCVFRMYCRAQDFLSNPDLELGESAFPGEEKAKPTSIPDKYPLTMRLALIRHENEMRLFLEWAREEALLRVTAMGGGFDEDAVMEDDESRPDTPDSVVSAKRKAEEGAGGGKESRSKVEFAALYSMNARAKNAQGLRYKDETARFDWRDFESAKETWAASAAGWWHSDFTQFIEDSEKSLNKELNKELGEEGDVDLKSYDKNKAVVLKEHYSRTRDDEQLAKELDKYLDVETAVKAAERALDDAKEALRVASPDEKAKATRERDAASRALDTEKREAVLEILKRKRQKARSERKDRQELARILAGNRTTKDQLDAMPDGPEKSARKQKILEDARKTARYAARSLKKLQLAKEGSDRKLAIREELESRLGVPPESVAETVVKMMDFDNERDRLTAALDEEYRRRDYHRNPLIENPHSASLLEKLEELHEDGDKTRTDLDEDFNKQQIDRLFVGSQTVDSILRASVGMDPSQATREAKEGPVVFNRGYARYLLRQHVEALKKAHGDWSKAGGNAGLQKQRGDAKYCQPHAALGNVDTPEGLAAVVEQLLPFFESMCTYRQAVLAAKRALLIREIEMLKPSEDDADASKEEVVRQKSRVEKLRRRIVGTKKGVLDESISADLRFLEDWELDGQRMIDAAAGRVRDPASKKPATDTATLAPSQPTFLPLRVFAPPRVGKSATALLVASLAKRLGMLVMYSVAPNKLTPIYELEQKLKNIGWQAPKADTPKKDDTKLSIKFNAVRIDSVIKQELLYRSYADVGPKDKVTKRVDMVLYSSEVDSDARRAGGLLAHLKLRGRPVFHIRDEAQSIAQQLKNEDDPTHSTDVPSPPTLQYLRAFYGNLYGLNCHVTATHFPTLLEEGTDMWGYIGTAQQNSDAGMPPASREGAIRKFPATHVLPRLLPALLPTVPDGYVGVEHMRTFRTPTPEISAAIASAKGALGMAATPEAVDAAQQTLADLEKSAERSLTETKVVGYNDDGSPFRGYQEVDPEKRRLLRRVEKLREQIRKLETKQQVSEDMNAGLEDRRLRRSKRNTNNSSAETQAKFKAEIIKLEAELAAAVRAAAEGEPALYDPAAVSEAAGQAVGGDGDPSAAYAPDSSDEETERTDEWREKARQLVETQKQDRQKDVESVQAHFDAFLKEGEFLAQRDVNAKQPQFLVPTYVGALNSTIQKNGMLSIMLVLSEVAKKHHKDVNEKRPLAFVLFTSVIEKSTKIPGIPEDSYVEGGNGAVVCTGAKDGKPQHDWKKVSKDTPRSAVCFQCSIQKKKGKTETSWEWFFVSSAGAAISYMHAVAGAMNVRPIVAVLGYDMLKAGLTIQKSVGNYHYCPRHLALATSELMPLDAQLQIAGRTFFDFFPAKQREAVPPSAEEWPIDVLGSVGLVERLKDYSNMEKVLSRAGNAPMYKAIHSSFMASVVQANTRGGQGVVGSRGGAITPLLGFTPFEYARRLKIHLDQKKKRLGKNVAADLEAQLQKLESAEANAEMDAGEASTIQQAEKDKAQLEGAQCGEASQCCGLAQPDVEMQDAEQVADEDVDMSQA